MTHPCLRQTADGVLLDLRVVPRASANAIVGLRGQALKERVTAPPVDSAANVEVVRFLAETLGLPRGVCPWSAGPPAGTSRCWCGGSRWCRWAAGWGSWADPARVPETGRGGPGQSRWARQSVRKGRSCFFRETIPFISKTPGSRSGYPMVRRNPSVPDTSNSEFCTTTSVTSRAENR